MQKSSVFTALLIASIAASGCKSNPPAAAPAPGQSAAPSGTGTLNSNGTVTPPARQAPAPEARTVASAPASAATAADRPAPPPPAPVSITAPIGTRVLIRTTETLSASHNEVGDGFTGVLNTPVVSGGQTLFARGTPVTGTVVASKGRGRFKGAGALGIEVSTIGGVKVQTSEYERAVSGKGKRTGGFIGGGAGLGALIGGLAGGGKGALIGGLAGAGAGTAGAAYTGNKDVIINSESLVTFNLTAPLTITK